MAQKKKRKLKKKYRVLRGIYAAIVAIAAVIVIGYGVYKVAVPAPAQAPVASTTDQTQEQVPGMETGDHTRREQTYIPPHLPGPGQRQCRRHHAGDL